LGGLMQDTVTESEDRVPVLGSIPLLGNLFSRAAARARKTNLLVFLRPTYYAIRAQRGESARPNTTKFAMSKSPWAGARSRLLPGEEKQPSIPAIPFDHRPHGAAGTNGRNRS